MKKYIILLALLISGCNDQQVIQTSKWMVVHPDEAMYHCPVLRQFPDWKNLTDSQVAKLIVQLHKNNITCKSSIDSIKTFLNDAELKIKKGSK
jgi:hypothetical protein